MNGMFIAGLYVGVALWIIAGCGVIAALKRNLIAVIEAGCRNTLHDSTWKRYGLKWRP